ncbi:PSD1 and planctomycete cytochrome C domain-containing protein [Aureibaculum conchae]|uniref:PSD1 and planctomycete cytochrome C domain-containing protein n=1 Tax=Aureibaculum sp. 2308TA14-22 TaxID=3108392 RepID=UPI0033978C53
MLKKLSSLLKVGLTFLVIFFISCSKSTKTVDFSRDIKPILNKNCITCHGGVKKNAGFSLLFEEEAFANTESGRPAIIKGNASGSELIKRLHEDNPELRMPYKKPKLTDKEIELLTQWINEGANWGEHWAYSLPEKVEVPNIVHNAGLSSNNNSFAINSIDNFILNKLKSENLQPNGFAEKNTIARRVALDLIGLPPSDNHVEQFIKGTISYETIVDSLLAKPAFGEKWASWWLDMARFADSKGYEKDNGRTMHKYRDWVIKAFNNDMPYNQFTIEQLAGDLLPEPSTDQLIATAFHRNTMNNDEGGTEDEEFRVASVIDRVNTTFEVWQSTTMGCVQCHSHPYDPFKHKEYYQLMAFFDNTMDADTPGEEPTLKFYNDEQQQKIEKIINWVKTNGNEELAELYNNFLLYNQPIYQAHLAKDFNNGELADTKWLALWDGGSCKMENIYTQNASFTYLNYWSGIDGTTMRIRKDNKNGEILSEFKINKTNGNSIRKIPFKKVDGKVSLYFEATNNGIAKQVNTSFIRWLAFIPDIPGENKIGYKAIEADFLELLNTNTEILPITIENPDYMKRTTQVFERGNWLLKGDTVETGVPASLNAWNNTWENNRLGLSKWIVDKKNPLTARTLVNRVWHQLFGRGLVSTVEDIGSQSEPPSHPKLLDWLALRFMNEHNWSIKSLIKEIVMSGTYRQSSETTSEQYQLDPENEFYARGPRQRLSAEQIRDQALFVSGLLSNKMYGPSVMPPQPDGVWQTVYSGQTWRESDGEDKYRRGVYTYIKRTSPYPSFLTFDAGSREVCTIRRTVTNTPLQALVTLNDPVYLEAAYYFAKKMQQTDNTIEENIAFGYKKATYSEITEEKLETLIQLYQTAFSEFNKDENSIKSFLHLEEKPSANLAALTLVANAIMNLDEFLTKA